jgi:hypothetical protein
MPTGCRDRGAAVARLRHDLDRVVGREHGLQAGPHQVVVVDEQDLHFRSGHAPSES